MENLQNTIFISYRQSLSSFVARSVYLDLREHGYDVFMDVESINSGEFEQVILSQIAARTHFLVILTPGTTDRFKDPNDMVRREIEQAIRLDRNIVPLLVNDFKFEEASGDFVGNISVLPGINGLTVPHEYFEEAMNRLRSRFLNKPVQVDIQSPPKEQADTIRRKLRLAIQQTVPTQEEIEAERLAAKGQKCMSEGKPSEAVSFYSRALQLNPDFSEAYELRGDVQLKLRNYQAAIDDFSRTVKLKPYKWRNYVNRGLAYDGLGNFRKAIKDYDTALRLKPDAAVAYNNRGWVRYEQGDLDEALKDSSRAIAISPDSPEAYHTRGMIYYEIGELSIAVKDLERFLNLSGNIAKDEYILQAEQIVREIRNQPS